MKLIRKLTSQQGRIRTLTVSSFEFGKTLIISLAAVLLIRSFVAQPFLVSGASMEPNFYDGDYLLIDEIVYRLRNPSRGEVIVFKYPGNPRSYYIKRVIGLPGEKVVINKGVITVYNGDTKEIIKEDYITPSWTFGNFEIELGRNEYFVMGDNRNFSFDSRSWGALNDSNIIGLVRLRLWPINKVAAFTGNVYGN